MLAFFGFILGVCAVVASIALTVLLVMIAIDVVTNGF